VGIIYAMSDIHGFYDIMQKNLDLINFSNEESKLILCGDYIDYGPDSCKVLYKIKDLINRYPSQVVAIKGNHETMFLDFLSAKENDIWNVEWLSTDKEFYTANTFITKSSEEEIKQLKTDLGYHDYLFRAAKIIKKDILTNHAELIQWLKSLPLYYETETQIFVHAGIDEEAGEYWKYGTSNEYFVSKFPATFGKFYKDIIAGHIGTNELAKDNNYHDIYWDKQSHYYIDGTVQKSGSIPMLAYDTETKKYSRISAIKILEWNVNQSGWIKNKTPIPNFVIKEIINEQKPDIFVLVEVFDLKGEIERLSKEFKGYTLFFVDRETINNTKEVLIGIKCDANIVVETESQIKCQDGNSPNFLQVDVKYQGKGISVIGMRIKIDSRKQMNKESKKNYEERMKTDYKERKLQLDSLIEHVNRIENSKTIIMGDFNNSRFFGNESALYKDVKHLYKGYLTEYYNYHLIKQDFNELGYDIFTPSKGYSWGGYIKNDHIVARGLKISKCEYKDDYKKRYSEIYNSIGDYCPGIPDHTILTAVACIIEPI